MPTLSPGSDSPKKHLAISAIFIKFCSIVSGQLSGQKKSTTTTTALPSDQRSNHSYEEIAASELAASEVASEVCLNLNDRGNHANFRGFFIEL